jgi:hypothetical protein
MSEDAESEESDDGTNRQQGGQNQTLRLVLQAPQKRFSTKGVERWRKGVRKIQIEYGLLNGIYPTLEEDKDIRLAMIHPGSRDEMICYHLEQTALPKTQIGPHITHTKSYIALSYNWDYKHDNATHEIQILDSPSPIRSFADVVMACVRSGMVTMPNIKLGKSVFIRPNLWHALRQLRRPDKPVALWVDALCINGFNYEEKGAQVTKMPATFSNAREVCLWLGPGTTQSHLAMSFIPKILNLNLLDTLVSDDSALEQWHAFRVLTTNRWFSRRWVVLEVALARYAVLRCGPDTVTWSDFATAVALYKSRFDQLKYLYLYSRKFDHDRSLDFDFSSHPSATEFVSATTEFVDATSNLVRRFSDGSVSRLRYSIEELVSNMAGLKVSHPSDAIYALLPLATDAANIKINYAQTSPEVFSHFVAWSIKASTSLDIICRHWAPDTSWLPSWILTVSGSAYVVPNSTLRSRVNGDSLVGGPGRPIYNACKGLPPASVTFWQSEESDFDDLLQARGIKVDTIGELGARSVEGIIFRESLEMGGLSSSGYNPDVLWRTLVANRDGDGKDPPIWYRQAFQHCLDQRTAQGDIMTPQLIERSPRLVAQFLKRVQAVTWDRKFFKTSSHSLFGMAPSQTRHGDIVCVLFGCSVPVILREIRDDLPPEVGRDRNGLYVDIDTPMLTMDPVKRYEFIGECYVHDIMEGEVKDMDVSEPEIFILQ